MNDAACESSVVKRHLTMMQVSHLHLQAGEALWTTWRHSLRGRGCWPGAKGAWQRRPTEVTG